jgi:branched-chain amino acid transport system ATP-binding protein
MAELLALEGVASGYGESVVLEDARLVLAHGETAAVLGRNGAGKTTLLTTMLGLTRLHRGTIRWQGRDVTRWAAHRRAGAGMGWVPQERGMWRSLTVDEHLACVARPGPWTIERVKALFPRLAERRSHRGMQLSGGEQQMLAIARALMLRPRLLLLDEPSFGLAPKVVADIFQILAAINREEGVAILLVEQNASLALEFADHAFLLETGRIAIQGEARALRSDAAVRRSYLGY